MNSFELTSFVISSLVLLAIIISKLSFRFGIPTLLLFLILGMLAGSDGIGKIEFENYGLAQSLGVVALCYILFAGGMETEWKQIKPILREGLLLSSIGVLITAFSMAVFSYYLLELSFVESLLLGSVVSSTDAASVFSLLRTSGIGLRKKVQSILELESGSNDPLAVILTITLIGLTFISTFNYIEILSFVFSQIVIGAILGLVFAKVYIEFINRINLEYDGLYTVIFLASGIFIYSTITLLNGNGFLGVYLAGLYLGNHTFIHKKSITRFMDGIGWLMQIVMFLSLGLLVFPSQLKEILIPGLLFSFFLIFVARPVGVFISLGFFPLNWKERMFISWVGLRGAAPIILATFPLTAGVANSSLIFNLVFFTVLSSLLIQGSSLKFMAKLFSVNEPLVKKTIYPFEFINRENSDAKLEEFIIPFGSPVEGLSIRQLKMPEDALVTIICRGENYISPSGQTKIEGGDVLLILVNGQNTQKVADCLQKKNI